MKPYVKVIVVVLLGLVFGRITPITHADGNTTETTTAENSPDDHIRGGSAAIYQLNLTRTQFDAFNTTYLGQGNKLVDIDVLWLNGQERYSAIWYPLNGTIYTLIQEPYADWETFFNDMTPKNGRYLDVEVDYFNGSKLYSAIFYENGDDYATGLRTTNSDSQFQSWQASYLNDGYAIVDFEAYTDTSGNTKYAGVWAKDPNQPMTTLYYGLESAEVSALIAPRIGRVIDIERYYSSIHGEDRWAMIFAADSGGEQYQRRGDTATNINLNNATFSDSNTHLIDIDAYASGSIARYLGLWGDTYKALHEVPAISADTNNQATGTIIQNLMSSFESNGQGVIGLYAKNVRTNQSIMYRADEPFYLASTAKIPIHIKYWREVQNGHLNANTSIAYTSGANSRAPWYTGDRSNGLGINDFGNSFTLAQYDSFMMSVSDNAATSLLMDEPTIGLTRDSYDVNEWLADIDGVGNGWGLVTSIHHVDRNIMWQGQVNDFPAEDSYFDAPPWALETHFRWADCDNDNFNEDDCWGDLQAFYGVTGTGNLPSYSSDIGHRRYYGQGLNTATPRATALLLEKLVEGALLDATNTTSAIQSMTEGTSFDNDPAWPNQVNVIAKGGVKGRSSAATLAVSDAAIFNIGPDDIVVAVLTEDNTRPVFNDNTVFPPVVNGIRNNFIQPIGIEVLKRLSADLQSCRLSDFNPKTVAAGQSFTVECTVDNMGGGNATGFDISFYASTNTTISTSDRLIGKARVSGINGYSNKNVALTVSFPDTIPPGNYYVGWRVDSDRSISTLYEIGEIDEDNNVGYDIFDQLVVTVPTAVGVISAETPTPSPHALFATLMLILGSTAVIKRQRFTD